ncbi:hypothetical protein SAMN05421858_4449 [Haladaptatus litoreus]|uniref:Uncharacterized protein n=1 Tax=Haladaptatus litoreus TaxID=553468 RepID=A0A1N7ENU6_9EURY|nr:hypothetical protein SAMN05421858_4449 [Haladaptatus litoreus]
MVSASVFRDHTQIVLPKKEVGDNRDYLERKFRITITEEKDAVRLIGSPCEIPKVRTWLISHGFTI